MSRVLELGRWARRVRPDVALSHNSYAQLLAARALRLPSVTAMDFEHQPANHIGFRAAQRILVPEAVPVAPLRRQGASAAKLIRYEGLKEELYLGDFEPDESILSGLGLGNGSAGAPKLVVARSAPAGAAYHRHENSTFHETLRTLDRQQDVRTVVLARLPAQRQAVRALGLERAIVPEGAIDSRSLLLRADAFLGAGGTMTREAALLGVPTYSIFAGERPAVDRWLEQRGLLSVLEGPEQLDPVTRRAEADPAATLARLRERGRALADVFIAALDERAGAGR